MDNITLDYNGREYTITPTDPPSNVGDDDTDTVVLAWTITRSDGREIGTIGFAGEAVPNDDRVRAIARFKIDQNL